MKSLLLTAKSLTDTFSIIKKAKLKKFYLLPGLINSALIYLLYQISKLISTKLFLNLEVLFRLKNYESIALLVIKMLVAFVAFLIYFFIYKALLLMILSPFFSYISERVESYITEEKFNFSFKENLYFVWRGVVISAKSFIKESLVTLIFLALSLLTPLSLFTPFFIFLVQCYFIGFSFMDYTLERHGFTPRESTTFLRKNALLSTINGSIFVALLIIPVAGIFLAPLISCVSITLCTLRIIEEDNVASTGV